MSLGAAGKRGWKQRRTPGLGLGLGTNIKRASSWNPCYSRQQREGWGWEESGRGGRCAAFAGKFFGSGGGFKPVLYVEVPLWVSRKPPPEVPVT